MEPLDDHSICLDRFRDISADIASLRVENCRLRSANAKLLKILANSGGGLPLNYGRPSATEICNRRQHCESKRGPSPESVSVKSRMLGGRSVGHTGEMELYDQGSFKTELCNKWEATGTCPYGGRCRFAHGIAELRTVPRDHRYKTEECRVVRAGQRCPYGHRCHFQHAPPARR